MKVWRIILAVAGIALLGFGVFRLLSEIPTHNLVILTVWLAAALVIQDAILAPSWSVWAGCSDGTSPIAGGAICRPP